MKGELPESTVANPWPCGATKINIINGNEIANILCNMHGTDANKELRLFNEKYQSGFADWTEMFKFLKTIER